MDLTRVFFSLFFISLYVYSLLLYNLATKICSTCTSLCKVCLESSPSVNKCLICTGTNYLCFAVGTSRTLALNHTGECYATCVGCTVNNETIRYDPLGMATGTASYWYTTPRTLSTLEQNV